MEGRPPETCSFCHSWSRATIFSANLTAGTHSSHSHRTSISRTDYLSHHTSLSKHKQMEIIPHVSKINLKCAISETLFKQTEFSAHAVAESE